MIYKRCTKEIKNLGLTIKNQCLCVETETTSYEKEHKNNYITLLCHESITHISGAGAEALLQGQLTCNISSLSLNECKLGAICTPKGRIIVNFRVHNNNGDFFFVMPEENTNTQQEFFMGIINKYKVFYDATISDSSDNWLRFGIWGESSYDTLKNIYSISETSQTDTNIEKQDYKIVHLVSLTNTPRYEIWIKPDKIKNHWPKLSTNFMIRSTDQWMLEDILEGLGWITSKTREEFIPQQINWHSVGGVDFKKGCYTGQEIIARLEYLGKTKVQLFHFSSKDTKTIEAGDSVIHQNIQQNNNSTDQPSNARAGTVISAIQTSYGLTHILAVVKTKYLESGALLLANNLTKLHHERLPYSATS